MRYSILLLGLALMSMATLPGVALAAPGAQPASPAFNHVLLQIINHDRQRAGLPELRMAPRLSHVALAHSLDMATSNYFSHVTPGGLSPYDRMRAGGVRYHEAGENLAWHTGSPSMDLLRAVEEQMLASPEHRANLLRASFTRVGIGIVVAGDRVYLTEDFKG